MASIIAIIHFLEIALIVSVAAFVAIWIGVFLWALFAKGDEPPKGAPDNE